MGINLHLEEFSEPSIKHPGVNNDENSNHTESCESTCHCPPYNSHVPPQRSEMNTNH